MEITDEAKNYWEEKRVRSMILGVVLIMEILYGQPYDELSPFVDEVWGAPLSELIRASLLLIAIIPIFSRVTDFLTQILKVKMISMGLIVAFILITGFRFVVHCIYYPTIDFQAVLMFFRLLLIDNFLLITTYMYTVLEGDFSLDYLNQR